jgi:uncharacterized protein (TIGR02145 family)
MNIAAVNYRFLIAIFLCALTACTRSEPEDNLKITTEDVIVYPEGIYIFSGTLLSIGDGKISEHGFCYSESIDPVLDETSIKLGSRNLEGSFNSTVYDLSLNTTYYVRAYAIVNTITRYGDEKTFTTPETLVPTVTDINHNIYHTVKIGEQTWMAENLRVINYPDKSPVRQVEDQTTWYNFGQTDKAYAWYDNMSSNYLYGALYTWPAAMNGSESSDAGTNPVQGVCPDGWHLPGDKEWKQLEAYLGISQETIDDKNWRGTIEGGKMKQQGTNSWISPNTGATNESGFNALPGGLRGGDGIFKNLGISARFWTSSRTGDYAWIRGLDNNSSGIFRNTGGLYEGHSVRCIKDN